MQVDPNEFRRLYASLSDDALLEVERADLTDIARQYYDQELAQRGLQNEPNSPETPAESREELASVGVYQSTEEYGFARGLLSAAGIPSFSQNEAKTSGKLLGIMAGYEVFVPSSLAEQAREVLEAQLSDDELAAQAEAAGMPEFDREEED